ncbi:MAG: Asp-tRNA(Asn)/Glu-tRNA(Gln) amidotransferase GatCAB subunit B, partial [Lachnospiraceae bacterium]|nr:Asp-tRNA(Asn)/Glu-tRNA(Gln) amidotransferase GatCAB subunit B [Lachnospiraceae bacterium]
TGTKALADMFEGAVALGCKPKEVSNWLMVDTLRLMKEDGVDASDLKFTAEQLAALIGLLDAGKINRPTSREVFEAMFRESVDPAAYVEEKGLIMEQDDDALRAVIEQVIADNPKSVADYKGGKKKAIGALVGQTMKAMKGKADPGTVNRMLAELLDE